MSTSHARAVKPTDELQPYQELYNQMLGNTTICSKVANLFGNVILLAIFVIGCIGAAHAFPGPIMGWTAGGLGVGYLLIKVMGGNFKDRVVDLTFSLCTAACAITFGALGIAGVLANHYIGYALISGMVVTGLASSYLMIHARHHTKQQPKKV